MGSTDESSEEERDRKRKKRSNSLVGEEKQKKRKAKLEALTYAGCGYGRAKKRLLTSFWEALWPVLEDGGWQKVAGVGDYDGATFFLPPGMSMEDKASKDEARPFDKVKDLINFILDNPGGEGKTTEIEASKAYSAKLAELERLEMGEQHQKQETLKEKKGNAKEKPKGGPGRRKGRPPGSGTRQLLDHTGSSWKNNRKHYPKISSRVGPEFQVSVIPSVGEGHWGDSIDSEENTPKYSLVWSSDEAKEKVGLKRLSNFMENDVPPNKREAAMALIHSKGYTLDGILQELQRIPPLDGTDWTHEEREMFHNLVLESRKQNLQDIARRMGKSVANFLTFYFGQYKCTEEYKLLKRTCIEEREAEEEDDDACGICGDGGNLMLCDTCANAFHIECLTPSLRKVPEGEWECENCVNRKFVKASQLLLSRMLQKGRNSEHQSKGEMEEVVHAATRKFLMAIGKSLPK